MPQIRQYPRATSLNLTDALVLDQLGLGTRYCTLAQLLAFLEANFPAAPYDIAMGYSQAPPPNNTFLSFGAVRAFSLPQNFTGSFAEFQTAPTSQLVLTVLKNGTPIGTITFPSETNGGSVGVFASSAAVDFNPDDILQVASGSALFGAADLVVTFEALLA
jgi:hypothetical protein